MSSQRSIHGVRYNNRHPDLGVINNLAQSLHVKTSTAADILSQFEYDVRIALKEDPFVVICQGRIITSSNYKDAENCKRCNLQSGCQEYTKLHKRKITREAGNYKKEE